MALQLVGYVNILSSFKEPHLSIQPGILVTENHSDFLHHDLPSLHPLTLGLLRRPILFLTTQ